MGFKRIIYEKMADTPLVKRAIKSKYVRYIHWFDRALFLLFRIFPINKDKITLCNFGGKDFGDNPKYIANEILKQGLFTDIVWLVSDKKLLSENSLPKNVRPVYINSLQGVYNQVTAKVWIDNARKSYSVLKRKKQIYLMVWHGSGVLKKIEKDVSDKLPSNYVNYGAPHDSKMCNLMVSGSKQLTELYKSSFWYNGSVLESGDARNDILLLPTDKLAQKRREILNIIFGSTFSNYEKKIVLYAPTFRVNHELDAYTLDFKKILYALKNKFGGDWLFLMRLHPGILEKSSKLKCDNNEVTNVTLYPDMAELLSIADILITDYSSCMFDYALTNRPCFLYQSDVAEYADDRGWYISLDELPFPRCESNDELVQLISNFDYTDYSAKLTDFMDNRIGMCRNGNASAKIVEWIRNALTKSNS